MGRLLDGTWKKAKGEKQKDERRNTKPKHQSRGTYMSRSSVLAVALLACAVSLHGSDQTPSEPVATFSILGYDPATGELGGAVQSRVFSVGNGVLWAEAGVGVVATQAIVDVSYGPKGLALLRAGMSPAAIIKAIWESDPDPRPENWTKHGRQFAVIDAQGQTSVFTGTKASPWAGHKHR
jgi:hypothetical protein